MHLVRLPVEKVVENFGGVPFLTFGKYKNHKAFQAFEKQDPGAFQQLVGGIGA